MTQTHDPAEQTETKPHDNETSKLLKSPLLGLTAQLGGLADIVTVAMFVDAQKIRGLLITIGFIFVGVPLLHIRRSIYNGISKSMGSALVVSLLLMAAVGGFAGIYWFRPDNQDPRGVSPPSPPPVSGLPTPLPGGSLGAQPSGFSSPQESGSLTPPPQANRSPTPPSPARPSPTPPRAGSSPTTQLRSPALGSDFRFDEPAEGASVSDGFRLSGTTPDLGADSLWLTDYAYAGDPNYSPSAKVYYRDAPTSIPVQGGHWSTNHGRIGSLEDPAGTTFEVVVVRANPSCSQVIADKPISPRGDVIIGTGLPAGCTIIGTLHIKKA